MYNTNNNINNMTLIIIIIAPPPPPQALTTAGASPFYPGEGLRRPGQEAPCHASDVARAP